MPSFIDSCVPQNLISPKRAKKLLGASYNDLARLHGTGELRLIPVAVLRQKIPLADVERLLAARATA